MSTDVRHEVRAGSLAGLRAKGPLVTTVANNTVVLIESQGTVFAVDNRCPHMGFPLHRGSVHDGILTCHWHHARFDLASGGTFDPFADDVRTFPVRVDGDDILVDVSPRGDLSPHYRRRLREGLEDGISLVVAKSVLYLQDAGAETASVFDAGLSFGTANRAAGWGQGLTMHTCFANLLPHLDPSDRPRALFHGLSAVAAETAGSPPHFEVSPLPGSPPDLPTLKRWFRRFVEVRDEDGAERCIVTAIQAGAGHAEMSDLLFAAATDHRYIDVGHVADFSNKALEALQIAGWDKAAPVLSSLARGFARAGRMEESNAWRHPVDLVDLLGAAFERVPAAIEAGAGIDEPRTGLVEATEVLHGDDPAAALDVLLEALSAGGSIASIGRTVSYAAALRIAHFHTANEHSDWDTALHTFTFASAMHRAAIRAPSAEVVRGILDAAMSVYLDRFLNVPPAPLPSGDPVPPGEALEELSDLLDRQQQVNRAGALVAGFLAGGGEPAQLIARLGRLLLREDRDFHTIQTVEAAVHLYGRLAPAPEAVHALVAAARYLAAHAPTVRRQGQTWNIAVRLHRGERIYEDV